MVVLKNPITQMVKEAPTGISWTTFFFGFFVPLFRKDFRWFGIMLAAGLATGFIIDEFDLTSSLGMGVTAAFAFTYNSIFIKEHLQNGYKIINHDISEKTRNWLTKNCDVTDDSFIDPS